MKKSVVIATLFVLLQCVIYGFGDPISKVAYGSLSVFSLLTVRYWIGFAFLMLIFSGKVIRGLKACNWKKLILPSVCIAGTFIVSNVAIGMTSPTSVAFLKSTATVITPLMALIVYRKYYNPKHIPILAGMVVGLYLLCSPGGSFQLGIGEVLGFASAVFGAGSLVFAEDILDEVDPITITTVQTGTSAVLATLCSILFEGGVDVHAATPSIWMIILYMAIACTVCGYLLQNAAMKSISASAVAVLQCMYPVMTAVFSFFVISERLAFAGILGAAVIIVCVIAENLISDEKPQSSIRARSRARGKLAKLGVHA